jgi:cytochrome d ubiquinol oxidase subunit II
VGDLALSGFLLPLALVLGGLIVRAVARVLAHRDGPRHVIWDAAFYVGSLLPAALLGLLLGNVVLGVPLDADGAWAGSLWSLLHPYALLTGLTGLALLMAHGAAWVAVRTEGQLRLKAVAGRSGLHWLFLLLLAGLTVYTALEIPERLEHVLTRPTGWLSLALVVASIVGFRMYARGWADGRAFLAASATIVGLMGLAATGNYPALVPARGASGGAALTLANAAASDTTLMVMLVVVAVVVPLVLAYTVRVRRRSGGKISLPAASS